MKKRIRIMISLVLVLLMAGCLTACGTGTEITTTPKKAVFEMEGLDQGEEVETTALFNFKEGRIKVELEPGTLPRFKDKASGWIDYLEETFVGEGMMEMKDIESLRTVLASVPDRETIVHCDFHEGNVMIQDGELVLIDLDDICVGHPVFDLIFNYMGHVVAAQFNYEVFLKSIFTYPQTYFSTNLESDRVQSLYLCTRDEELRRFRL